ncbi:NAD(P)H-binding protein [Bifidobacterium sp. SO4]|uniref:NAD(P)H-binding protein n=1 Tax=Bifidobacterium sp. SO4 TaxID=2809030 RepID=UPI001F0AD23E|nr:NAD(P)H-binding protein [Bifidobacterium sp. SO4]
MGKLILTGVDGNLGGQAADYLLELADPSNLIFTGYNPASLEKYAARGVETRVADFNQRDGLEAAFEGGDVMALVSMPFVGVKRQRAQGNAVDAAKAAGVGKVVYTSLVNAGDPTNPSVEKKDHIWTEEHVKETGLDYIFLRNSQYAEAMITNYFTYVHGDGVLKNSQGDGLMAYISRRDCAKAVAHALLAEDLHHAILDINGPELMTISQFVEIGNEATGNHVTYQEITDEENYQVFDAMGVPRTTDGVFLDGSEAPFSSDGSHVRAGDP